MTNLNPIKFNYIITIHNKENLIYNVLNSVLNCMSENSTVYPVLDGCTDNTENIIDGIIMKHPDKKIIKVFEKDVHELRSINAGIRKSSQFGVGYNVILQDDVLINDFDIENKIISLYKEKTKLGIVSFRHGANLSGNLLKKKSYVFPLTNYVESVLGHNPNFFNQLEIGSFAYREIPIKSPICIPFEVIRLIGLPDEDYAPWDDIDFCYRVSLFGFNNGVYALDISSKVEWGTTRTKVQKDSTLSVQKKNLALFKSKHINKLANFNVRPIYLRKKMKVSNVLHSQSLPLTLASIKHLSKQIFISLTSRIFTR